MASFLDDVKKPPAGSDKVLRIKYLRGREKSNKSNFVKLFFYSFPVIGKAARRCADNAWFYSTRSASMRRRAFFS
jgi:hypothetical protein